MVGFSRYARVAIISAMSLLAVVLSGCMASKTARELRETEVPKGGEEASPALWEAIEQSPEQQLIAWDWFLAPLPIVARKNWFGVPEDQSVAIAGHYSRIGLGIPYEYLPLQYSYSKYRYLPGETEPAGAVKVRSMPFWAWSTTEGNPGPNLEADVKGIPLFVEWGSERGYSWYYEDFVMEHAAYRDSNYWKTLWWLGPAYLHAEENFRTEQGDLVETSESYFFPLYLGQTLGAVLWSDYIVEMEFPNSVSRTEGHGPIFGLLTYRLEEQAQFDPQAEDGEIPAAESKLRTVLAGLLWYEYARVENGDPVKAVDGPLWGLFGKGYHNGDPAWYVFRVPIKTGG